MQSLYTYRVLVSEKFISFIFIEVITLLIFEYILLLWQVTLDSKFWRQIVNDLLPWYVRGNLKPKSQRGTVSTDLYNCLSP